MLKQEKLDVTYNLYSFCMLMIIISYAFFEAVIFFPVYFNTVLLFLGPPPDLKHIFFLIVFGPQIYRYLESVHYNLDWLFKTKHDFEIPRASL